MREDTTNYTKAKQYIPRQWEDAIHEYQTDPFTHAIVGHLASRERARDAYWLWNHRGEMVEVPYLLLGATDLEYYHGEYPDPIYPEEPPAGINEWAIPD